MHYDILSKMKNSARAGHESLQIPYSKINMAIASILAREKFLKDVQKKTVNKKNFIDLKISYKNRIPAMSDFKIVSRPGRRIYMGYKDLVSVRQGYGLAVLSTPKGIMTNKEARREKVGGEYLFQIW